MRTAAFDLEALRREFLDAVEEHGDTLRSERVRELVGEELIRQLRSRVGQVRTRLQEPFTLVVVGDFKRGKSTLINALLQSRVVSTNVAPETVTINEITYGEALHVEAVLTDGRRVGLAPEELSREKLEPVLRDLPAPVAHLAIQAPVEWLKGMRVVDTPGVGDVMGQFDQKVHDYLTHADAVLLVVSALSPFSETEQGFLRASLLPQDFSKLFVLVNLLDAADNDRDAERVLKAVSDRVTRMFPTAQLFGISALDEVCRQGGLRRPNPERADALAAGFAAFRSCLTESVFLNRDWIQLDRAASQMERLLADFTGRVEMLKGALQSDRAKLTAAIEQCESNDSDLARKVAQHKQVMRRAIEEMAAEATTWMAEFLNRLEAEVVPAVINYPHEDLQRHFHFFLTDSLRQAMGQCLGVHRTTIMEAGNQARRGVGDDLGRLTEAGAPGTDVARATFGELTWSGLDTLQFLLGYTPAGILGDILVGQARSGQDARQRQGYQQRLQESLPGLRTSVMEEVQRLYRAITDRMEQEVEEGYRQEKDASLAAMRQARLLTASGETRLAETGAGLDRVLEQVAAGQQFLSAFGSKLALALGGE